MLYTSVFFSSVLDQNQLSYDILPYFLKERFFTYIRTVRIMVTTKQRKCEHVGFRRTLNIPYIPVLLKLSKSC